MKLFFFHFDIHYSLFDIYPPIFCGGPVLFSKSLNPLDSDFTRFHYYLSPYGLIFQPTLLEMIQYLMFLANIIEFKGFMVPIL